MFRVHKFSTLEKSAVIHQHFSYSYFMPKIHLKRKKEITKRRNNVRNKIAAAKYLFASIPLTDHETFSNGNLITPSKQSFTQTYKRPIVTQTACVKCILQLFKYELRIENCSPLLRRLAAASSERHFVHGSC